MDFVDGLSQSNVKIFTRTKQTIFVQNYIENHLIGGVFGVNKGYK